MMTSTRPARRRGTQDWTERLVKLTCILVKLTKDLKPSLVFGNVPHEQSGVVVPILNYLQGVQLKYPTFLYPNNTMNVEFDSPHPCPSVLCSSSSQGRRPCWKLAPTYQTFQETQKLSLFNVQRD